MRQSIEDIKDELCFRINSTINDNGWTHKRIFKNAGLANRIKNYKVDELTIDKLFKAYLTAHPNNTLTFEREETKESLCFTIRASLNIASSNVSPPQSSSQS